MKTKFLYLLAILPVIFTAGCTDPVSSAASTATTTVSACGTTFPALAACSSTATSFVGSICDGSSSSTIRNRCTAYVSCVSAASGSFSGSFTSASACSVF